MRRGGGALEPNNYGLEVIDTPVMSCSFGAAGENPVILYSDPGKLMEHIQRDHGDDAVLGFAGLFNFCRIAGESLDRFNPLSLPRSLGAIIDSAPSVQAKDALRKCLSGSA